MSRIGKSPVTIPSGVEVKVNGTTVTVKGPKGELTQEIDSCITIQIEGSTITFSRASDAPDHRAKHGLYRSLLFNMIAEYPKGSKRS
jgi:large subunit ribosomal protein L6